MAEAFGLELKVLESIDKQEKKVAGEGEERKEGPFSLAGNFVAHSSSSNYSWRGRNNPFYEWVIS